MLFLPILDLSCVFRCTYVLVTVTGKTINMAVSDDWNGGCDIQLILELLTIHTCLSLFQTLMHT